MVEQRFSNVGTDIYSKGQILQDAILAIGVIQHQAVNWCIVLFQGTSKKERLDVIFWSSLSFSLTRLF